MERGLREPPTCPVTGPREAWTPENKPVLSGWTRCGGPVGAVRLFCEPHLCFGEEQAPRPPAPPVGHGEAL